jgi:catechol 2,3-dioxygenase-like lactoylglutathione lyase family enzyme
MKLHHVAINVSNIKKSVEWYVKNMHATVEYEDDTWAMLCFGDVKMALTVASQHPPHIGIRRKYRNKNSSRRVALFIFRRP